MVKTLDKFAIGESGKVISVSGERKIKRRLYDMGITNGADIYLRKKAPLGDPIEVTVRSYELSLRNSEAACITMEVTPNV
ncbi:MAG: ferrous iron transport protein A [Clostridiales bacterium]|nr:ferrous iron transport protein A [Clostridiales bacterium]